MPCCKRNRNSQVKEIYLLKKKHKCIFNKKINE